MSNNTNKDPQHNNTNHTIELVVLSLAAIFFAVIGILQMAHIAGGF